MEIPSALAQQSREMIVKAPAQTPERDQNNRKESAAAFPSGQKHSSNQCTTCRNPSSRRKILMEYKMSEYYSGHKLKIKPERNRS